jgi:glutaredoxin
VHDADEPDDPDAPGDMGDTGDTGDTARVLLYTRPGCHLCDDARAVVEAVCAELGVRWQETDITTDADLHARYTEQIPVTLVDGRQHDFWRVDPGRLRAALQT